MAATEPIPRGRNQGPSPTTQVARGRKYSATEEHFGGFNFGGGNGQLDHAGAEFDWAFG
ncbi:hypothetical protein H8A97_22185 [Bradyrhizobium sp. Arg62]|uniref:hypothetical protein n=1 Tax=Bradyrhizobium brasilense TaxID=1419277 RepID=UPI001E402193|nr:hypothetical protein [Bradyrhizobium brasilense]MCC8947744.1 hypothetical protein [Bradyrhizobium brasilense]